VLRDVLAGAVGATRAVRALLYGFERLDAETYAGVVVLVSTGAELATLAAARAAAIDR
jgi:hypothetical protein